MATTTRTRTRKTRSVAAPNPEIPDVVDEVTGETADEVQPKTEEKAEAKPKVTATTYRTDEGFLDAQKALRSLSKGNGALKPLVMLITHLAWKTPNGTVGWTKGTTADVVSTADDLAIGTGTPIPQAMEVTLTEAEKVLEDSQKDAFDILSSIVRSHPGHQG